MTMEGRTFGRMDERPTTPVLDRMAEKHPCDGKMTTHSALIGQFLDWLSGEGISLGHWVDEPAASVYGTEYVPTHEPFSRLLARYHEVDEQEVEREKRALLKWISTSYEIVPPGTIEAPVDAP